MAFNPSEIKNEFPVFPTNTYKLVLESSIKTQGKPKENGFIGEYYKCTFRFVEGPFNGKKVTININSKAQSEKATNIGFISARVLSKMIASQNMKNAKAVLMARKNYSEVAWKSMEHAFSDLLESNVFEEQPFNCQLICKESVYNGQPSFNYSFPISDKVEKEYDEILKPKAAPVKAPTPASITVTKDDVVEEDNSYILPEEADNPYL